MIDKTLSKGKTPEMSTAPERRPVSRQYDVTFRVAGEEMIALYGRHIYNLAMAFGGRVDGPTPEQLDILRGYKAGEIEASTYSAMPLQKVVEDMLSLWKRLANEMDEAEPARPPRRICRCL